MSGLSQARTVPLMRREIGQQPETIARTIARNAAAAERIARVVRERGLRWVCLAARGSSDNACVYAKYLFGYVNRIPAGLAMPSLATLYRRFPDMRGCLVIGVSQSGASPDIVETVRAAARTGGYCVALTNVPGAPLTRHAHEVLCCDAGRERSVPATKSYTAQLAALALLSGTMAGDRRLRAELERVPAAVAAVISRESDIIAAAGECRFMQSGAVLGRGFSYATALETALKIKETCLIKAEALSGADFLHGPVAMVHQGFPVIAFGARDATLPGMNDAVAAALEKGASVIGVSSEERFLRRCAIALRVPATAPATTPFVHTVVGQLFACHLAQVRGLNPDSPAGLRKVTCTR